MSGVWREQSVPMTDRECALLALESIGAVVTNHTNTQCSVSIGGRSWTMRHTNGRYAIQYNAQLKNQHNIKAESPKFCFRFICSGGRGPGQPFLDPLSWVTAGSRTRPKPHQRALCSL